MLYTVLPSYLGSHVKFIALIGGPIIGKGFRYHPGLVRTSLASDSACPCSG